MRLASSEYHLTFKKEDISTGDGEGKVDSRDGRFNDGLFDTSSHTTIEWLHSFDDRKEEGREGDGERYGLERKTSHIEVVVYKPTVP